jgi:O-acetyl-ADP-ribose deacetylase (regulator of RNase III)
MIINYLQGDTTRPIRPNALIVHVCNNNGGWGKGFVLALSARWRAPERAYRNWFDNKFNAPQVIEDKRFVLGNVQFVPITSEDFWVANMIAQNSVRKKYDPIDKVFLDYDALKLTLDKSFKFAKEKKLSVHMPRIGCGLAGGKWHLIEPIINEIINMYSVDTYVYDFE